MDKAAEERGLHDLFEIGIILKGIDGTLELIGGAFLWLVSPGTLNAIVLSLFHSELTEDPKDWFVNLLLHTTQNLTAQFQNYAGILLIAHGAVKIFLIIGLLRGKLWAYPAAIIVFIIFIVSQLYQLSLAYSLLIWVITIVDVLVVLLIAHEYREVKRKRPAI
jgi:uncharacterized membrane protein